MDSGSNSQQGKASRAVFLDRDGTINIDKGYIARPEDIELLPSVASAISLLNRAGLKVVIITNQSGIARGFFSVKQLHEVNSRLKDMLLSYGAMIDAIYFCPHHPEAGVEKVKCDCRKPGARMLLDASSEMNIDLERSFMVGDKPSDVQAGKNAGAASIYLVPDGKISDAGITPDYTCKTLMEAAIWITDSP